MHELEDQKDTLVGDADKLQVLFKEMVQICLWYVFSSSEVWLKLVDTITGEMRL